MERPKQPTPAQDKIQTISKKSDLTDQEKAYVNALGKSLGLSKHAVRLGVGYRFQQMSFTKRNPWQVRAERRAQNKRAKQARKLNR